MSTASAGTVAASSGYSRPHMRSLFEDEQQVLTWTQTQAGKLLGGQAAVLGNYHVAALRIPRRTCATHHELSIPHQGFTSPLQSSSSSQRAVSQKFQLSVMNILFPNSELLCCVDSGIESIPVWESSGVQQAQECTF